MKILILTNIDTGLYIFRRELVEKLSVGNEVLLCLPDGEFRGEFEKLGCKYIPLEFDRRGMNPLSDLKLMLSFRKIIKREKPDVVLTYTIKPNVYGGIACRLTKTPYIANVTGLGTAIENGGIVGKLSVLLYKLGLKRANCVFFQNSSNRDLFIENRIVKSHSRTIPGSGVNLAYHGLREYPPYEGKWKFLFVGRIMRDKGINELLEAIKTAHNECPDIELSIVGGCDEDYESELKKAEETGYIHYFGVQKDVRPFYKDTHCTVLPSYHEGTANVLLESASAGRPVIASRVPGCRETFDENITGFGCEAKDPESLAEAMIKFIGLSYEEKKKMGANGRKKVEKEYDRQIVVDAYTEEISKAENKE